MIRRIETWIVTLVGLMTMFGSFVADWNATHIFNPRWMPHAKYHNAQTMSLGVVLGACALYFLWRRKGAQSFQFRVALVFASLYWITQVTAGVFPGVAFFDPEFAASIPSLGGIPLQIGMDAVLLGLLAVAYIVRRSRREQMPAPAVHPPPRATRKRRAEWVTGITPDPETPGIHRRLACPNAITPFAP